ncbi:MAG: hypothetical protein EPO68_17745 [Planctomycetota bacterium]|nr:MAG: hypothetical protein EPO68_17745 [Planctomycetota bacterium]
MVAPQLRFASAVLAIALASACASVEFKRESPSAGTFRSSGTAFTILSIDFPRQAMQIARENAVDAGQSNLVIEHARVVPDLGWWNWLLDIVSVRYAVIEGRWGHADAPTAAAR